MKQINMSHSLKVIYSPACLENISMSHHTLFSWNSRAPTQCLCTDLTKASWKYSSLFLMVEDLRKTQSSSQLYPKTSDYT